MPEGGHRDPPHGQAATWRDQVCPPLVPYFSLNLKTLREESFSMFVPLFCRHRDPEMGISRSSCPGTLPEGGLISGGPSITMLASEMLRE